MEPAEQEHDPTLQEANDALAEIVEAWTKKTLSDESRKELARRYAAAQMEYARTHTGQIEMADGSDASPYDIERWRKALEEAQKGSWETMKKEIGDDAIGFNDPDDEEWTKINQALSNLSASL